jgi:hypothetical protein
LLYPLPDVPTTVVPISADKSCCRRLRRLLENYLMRYLSESTFRYRDSNRKPPKHYNLGQLTRHKEQRKKRSEKYYTTEEK